MLRVVFKIDINDKSLTSQRRSQKHCSSSICAREENTNMLIFPSFLLAWEWLYLISTLHNTKLKAYFLLLYIALGTCTRWAKWDGPTQGCSYPRIRGQPGKILMTLDLISDSNALSTLVSNWLIHMNWAVSICRLSQYYTKRASPEPPYLQRGIKAVYMSSV